MVLHVVLGCIMKMMVKHGVDVFCGGVLGRNRKQKVCLTHTWMLFRGGW